MHFGAKGRALTARFLGLPPDAMVELLLPGSPGVIEAIAAAAMSDRGLTLTESSEGLRLRAYQDCAGIWTIGYGHTGKSVGPGQTITAEQAATLLRADIGHAEECVNSDVHVQLTQNQFDALVDFTFNAGGVAFLTSTLLRDLNAGNYEATAAQFGAWVHAGGKVVPGLVSRRAAEAALFREAA